MTDLTDYALTDELCELEHQLASYEPCEISVKFMARLERSVQSASALHESEEAELWELEEYLEQISPASMSVNILERMTLAMDRWHEHVPEEEKVVPFNKRENTTPTIRKRTGGGMFAAAAAVALLGALSALVMPRFLETSPSGQVADQADADSAKDLSTRPTGDSSALWVSPDSLSHKVTYTTDQGTVMTRDNKPHRCIRVDYVDRVVLHDKHGREVIIKRPRVKYMLVPMETN